MFTTEILDCNTDRLLLYAGHLATVTIIQWWLPSTVTTIDRLHCMGFPLATCKITLSNPLEMVPFFDLRARGKREGTSDYNPR